MSRSKSQLKPNSEVRSNTAVSIPIDLTNVRPSTASTRTRDSFKAAFFNFMREFKKKHKNKTYQHVMRLGSRRWRAMTQADRAPYVLEAARNRRIARPTTANTQSDRKKSAKEKRSNNKRCPACGHRKTSRERRSPSDSPSNRTRSRSSSTKSKSS